MPPPLRGVRPNTTAGVLLSRSSSCYCSAVATTTQRALFSSTPSHPQQQQIPPESPLYINVPNPPQDQSIEAERELKPIKGHLPIPRQIFKHRDAYLKPTAPYIAKSAPEPRSWRALATPTSDEQAWKRRMAESRRENIASGLRDLWSRKQRIDTYRAREQERKLAINRAAATAPEREDDRLTRASVNAKTLLTKVMEDPYRFERAQASRARTQAILDARAERRRDAVQELYMSARQGFIVDEAALEAAVDKEFDPARYSGQTSSGQPVTNIWDLYGPPDTVADMLREVSGRDGRVVVDFQAEQSKTEKRQMRVAEDLTGGRMK